METPSQKYLHTLGITDAEEKEVPPSSDRRSFLKKAGLGGLALGAFIKQPFAPTLDYAMQKVNKSSAPTDLKITDMRYAVVMNGNARCPIIRIDTNQGISGWGEVRDGATWRYALFLKSRILGMNPCNVEMIFKKIKQFGYHGRQGGGVCAVEMALWDLAGKAYGVPAYQMLGGKYRDKIRLYADTPRLNDPSVFAAKMKDRIVNKGYTFLKMDFGLESLHKIPDTVVNSNFWDISRQWENTQMTYGGTEHPFTQIQITEKGLGILADYVGKVRDVIGYDIPLASDHYGHFDLNNAIRLGKAVDKYRLAWLEDLVPWRHRQLPGKISI